MSPHLSLTLAPQASPETFESPVFLESSFVAGLEIHGTFFIVLHDGFPLDLSLESSQRVLDGFIVFDQNICQE
jgi:hypothetical protein